MLQASTLATKDYMARLFLDNNGKLHLELAHGEDRKLIPADPEQLNPQDAAILRDALKLMVRRSPVVGLWLRKTGYEKLMDFPFDLANPLDTVSRA